MATPLKNIPFNNFVPTLDSSGAMYEMKLRKNPPCGCGCEEPGYIQFVDTTCTCGCTPHRSISIVDNDCHDYMIENAYQLVDDDSCSGQSNFRMSCKKKYYTCDRYVDVLAKGSYSDYNYCSYPVKQTISIRDSATTGCYGDYCGIFIGLKSCGYYNKEFEFGYGGYYGYFSDMEKYPVRAAHYLENTCWYGSPDQLTFELNCSGCGVVIDLKVGYCGDYCSYPVKTAAYLNDYFRKEQLTFEQCYGVIDFQVGCGYYYCSYPVKTATQLKETCGDQLNCSNIGFTYYYDPFTMITFKNVCGELPVRYAYQLTDECGRYSTKISYSDLTSNPGDYCIVAFSNCY